MPDSVKSHQELLLRAGEGWVSFQRGPALEIALKVKAMGWREKQGYSDFSRTMGQKVEDKPS